MAGYIELATLKAPVVADQKAFKQGMEQVKKQGKSVANEVEKQFAQASKQVSNAWDIAAKKIQKGLKTTEAETKELTKSAQNIYKEGFGKSVNDVVRGLMQTKRALGDLDSESIETATKRALELRDTMGVKMSRTLKMAKQEMRMYGSTADEAFDRVEKRLDQNAEAWEKLGTKGEKLSTIGTALTAGLTVPLVGLTTASVKMASDFESANARIVSSLGLTEKQSSVTKTALEKIYSDGFGENMEDVAESIVQVKQQLSNIPDDQIVKVTENALVLRDTLGQDMNESLRGVNSLMVNFGMSADDAMDLYVAGVQSGLDKTGELGDNLAEYGQLWAQAGFSAKDMFSVLENGLKSGAYNLDKVNDFVKEFTISLNDGRIEDNLSRFSEGTQSIFHEFKEGKKTAQDVFQSVVHDLENTKNQQEKLTLASTVWSALGEDNAMKIIESLNDVNHTYDDVSGTMEKVKEQQNEIFGARAKSLFREAQTALLPLGETLLDLAEKHMPEIEQAVKTFSDTLASMSDEDIQRILKIGGFVAVAGPTVSAIGKVTQGISSIGGALRLGLPLLSNGTKGLGLFGGAANTAAGASGVGAMTGALGAGGLAGTLPLIVGAGGLLAIGAVAWKTFGEEAWNSSQRVKQWGSDIGEEADKALTKFKTFSDDSINAMKEFESGVNGSAKKVSESFEGMQQTIAETAQNVDKEMEETIKKLPTHLQKAAKENLAKQKESNQELVATTGDMAKQVATIYERHNNDVTKFTDEEKQIVLNNRQSMIQAELNLLDISAKDKKSIIAGMNGDLDKMSKSQVENYFGSMTNALRETQNQYKEQVATIKEAHQQGLISEDEYNSEMKRLKSTNMAVQQQYAEEMIRSWAKMGEKPEDLRYTFKQFGIDYDEVVKNMSSSTSEAAQKSDLLADATKNMSNDMIRANEQWNGLVFDSKTGEVKTNLSDVLKETVKTEDGWNNMKFMLKNANLKTNAREEVAIAVGEAGKWQSLSVEDKKLIVKNDEAKLKFFDTIQQLNAWNLYATDRKVLGVDNADAVWKLLDSEAKINRWNSLSTEDKKLLANNQDFLVKIAGSETTLNQWNTLPVNQKTMLANNQDLLNKVFSSESMYNAWCKLPDNLKQMLGDNADIINKLNSGEIKLNEYDRTNPELKQLLGDSYDVQQAASTGEVALNDFKRNNPAAKTLEAIDNASGPASDASREVGDFWSLPDVITKTLNVVGDFFGFAKGSPGLPKDQVAMVNDQPGRTYEELITLPNGPSFIPKGRNVVLPLPKGTRIDTAAATERIRRTLPRYASGMDGLYSKIPRDTSISSQSMTQTKIINHTPQITINEPHWYGKEDLRRTLEEAAFLLNMDAKGAM